MKKAFLLIVLIIAVIGCKKNSVTNYSGDDTDWKTLNLYGKVKKIKQYRANYLYPEKTKVGKLLLKEQQEFTNNGFLKQTIQFDLLEKPRQRNTFQYDVNGFLTKSVYHEISTNQKKVITIKKDTLLKKDVIHFTVNDAIQNIQIQEYDAFDNVKKETKINNGDTISTRYEYQYNKEQKVIKTTEIRKGFAPKVIGEYKYNNQGKLVEAITRLNSLEFKAKTIFENEKIVSQTSYITALNLEEDAIDSFVSYDQYYNPIIHKSYEDSKLHSTYMYTYKYDDAGNWIERTSSIKRHFEGSDEFAPMQIFKRKIVYWE